MIAATPQQQRARQIELAGRRHGTKPPRITIAILM